MNINPFYSIFLAGNEKLEITEYVESFTHTQSTKKDNTLTLKIYAEKADIFDSLELNRGKYIQIQYGYKSGAVSDFYSLRISDIQYSYGATININVTCTDKGNVMKKSTSNKVWSNVTTGDIVKEISAKYGLEYQADYEGKKWDNLVQGNLNDFEFLQQVAEKEKDGNFIIYVHKNKVLFTKRGLDKNSSLLLEYRNPESGIISFKPKETETTLKPESISAQSTGENSTVADADNANVPVLGEFKYTYNANGESIAANLGKLITLPEKDTNVAENRLKTAKKEGTLKGLTATLSLVGNPGLNPNEVISLAGVFLRHTGNYLITEVKNTITKSGGYITDLELNKNGQKIGEKPAEVVNKTVGSEKGKTNKVTLLVYDADGNTIGQNTGSDYNQL